MQRFLDQNVQEANVLFVDDDTNFLDLIQRRAETASGLNARVCSDPEEVQDLLEQNNIDCIISDYKMSELDGLELLEKVRAEHPHMPFILFTSKGSEHLASDAMSKGATDYIVKEEGLNRFDILENRVKNAVKNKRSEEDARRMLERITDAFFSLNKNWQFNYVNDEAERLLQQPREDLIGEKVWDKFSEAAESRFRIKYEQAMDSQEPVYFEEYYKPLEKWFSVRAHPSETGLSVYFRDITDSKEREGQLRDRFDQQQATTELLRMALEEGDVVELQHAAARMVAEELGNDFAQVLKRDGDRLVTGASYGMGSLGVDNNIIEPDENHQEWYTFTSQDPVVVQDHNDVDFERSELLTFLNARSGISAVIGEYEDPWGILSTYSKKARSYSEDEINFVQGIANILGSAIENQEQYIRLKEYERVIDSVSEGIFVMDNSCKIIMANEAFADISGYTEDQLIGRKQSLLEEDVIKDSRELETEIEHKDGQKIDVKTRIMPVELPDGTRGHVAVVKKQK